METAVTTVPATVNRNGESAVALEEEVFVRYDDNFVSQSLFPADAIDLGDGKVIPLLSAPRSSQ